LAFVQRLIKQEKDAWNEFIAKYSRLIYSYIHSALGSGSHSFGAGDASDIFQSLFASLLEDSFHKLNSFKAKNNCSLASWLRVVSINFTIDWMRRARPALSLDQEGRDGEPALLSLLADTRQDSSSEALGNEKLEGLKECVDGLSQEDRFLIEMHFLRGIGLQQLSSFLDLSRGAVDMKKSRLLEKLRECFRRKGFVLDL
jgi:RNA polymerase sigma-70 factor (ECF subfamily)